MKTAVYIPSGELVTIIGPAPDGVNLIVELPDGYRFITGKSTLQTQENGFDRLL